MQALIAFSLTAMKLALKKEELGTVKVDFVLSPEMKLPMVTIVG